MKHSPEPWSVRNVKDAIEILDSLGMVVCRTRPSRDGQTDFHRIVACVNACRGIPTSALSNVMDRLFTAMMEAEAKRLRGWDERDLPVDLLAAADLMKTAGVDLTELLKQCKLETPA